MTWHCHACRVNNTPKMTFCRSCHAHWSAVCTAPRRSRSKSSKKYKKETSEHKAAEQVSQEADTWAVFPDKLPWISTTPASRANCKAESGISMEKPLGMPPQANSATSSISRRTNGAYSRRGENAAAFEGVASHGHGSHGVNGKEVGTAFHEGSEGSIQSNPDSWAPEQAEQAHKLKSQVATAAQKIKDLDGEWATFVNTTLSKVRHHGEMFQNCRADLMEHYNAKIQELATVKKEMTLASQSMLGPQWTEPVIPEMPDLEAQFDALQDTMNAEGMVGQIDLTATQATAGKGLARALRPFRGSGSPSKVATHHLKVKAQDVKDGKEAKIKEKEREDK